MTHSHSQVSATQIQLLCQRMNELHTAATNEPVHRPCYHPAPTSYVQLGLHLLPALCLVLDQHWTRALPEKPGIGIDPWPDGERWPALKANLRHPHHPRHPGFPSDPLWLCCLPYQWPPVMHREQVDREETQRPHCCPSHRFCSARPNRRCCSEISLDSDQSPRLWPPAPIQHSNQGPCTTSCSD